MVTGLLSQYPDYVGVTGDQRLVRMGDMLPRLMASPTTHRFLQHTGQLGLVLEKIHRKNPLHHKPALCCVDYCPYSRTQRLVLIMSASRYIIICTKAPPRPPGCVCSRHVSRVWQCSETARMWRSQQTSNPISVKSVKLLIYVVCGMCFLRGGAFSSRIIGSGMRF